VDEQHFQKVASFTRAALLSGRFVGYLLGQLFTSYNVLNYYQLNIFSIISVSVAFLLSFVLPNSQFSELFNPKMFINPEEEDENDVNVKESNEITDTSTADLTPCTGFGLREKITSLCKFLFFEAKEAFSNRTIRVWSLWWAFASCGSYQVSNYVQNLWQVLTPYKNNHAKRHLYNGAVEAAGTFLGKIGIL